MRRVALTLAAALLALPAAGQERLHLAPGHTLRFHAAPGPEQPVSRRYLLELDQGEWLAVTSPAAIAHGAGTEPALRLTGPQGQASQDHGRLVHQADSGGTWMLDVTEFHALAISRYPPGHPVVDPAVAPAEVRLEAAELGLVTIQPEPMNPRYDDVPPPSGWPARLAISLGERMTIHLYRRAALRQMELWPHDPTRNLAALLAADGPIEPGLYLPMFPLGEGFLTFTARPERVRGTCFSFLRYLGHWTQEETYPFATITYAALGLSRDGEWFAVATAELVPAPVPGQPAGLREGRSAEYEAALAQAMSVDLPAVSPPLAQLDAAIGSLAPPCDAR